MRSLSFVQMLVHCIVTASLLICALPCSAGDAKTELFAQIKKYRKTWTSGHVHVKMSGMASISQGDEAKVWWDGDRVRLEAISNNKTEVRIRTADWRGISSDFIMKVKGRTFEQPRDIERFDSRFKSRPNDSWLTIADYSLVPIEEWLESRPNEPIYLKTPNGFSALYCHENNRNRYAAAIKSGQSLDGLEMMDSCMTVTFDQNGLPLLLEFHGVIPENSISVIWEWDTDKPKKLERMTSRMSRDFGKTDQVTSKMVVLKSERGLRDDRGLFDSP